MKILITGSKGMLGQYISEVFSDCDLVCADRKELDITNEDEVKNKVSQIKPDIIINCAAYNNVDKAESEPDLANLINGYAVGFLAKAAKNTNALLVHYSTDYVFDGTKEKGYIETDTPGPQSAYGFSKLLGEQEVQKNTDKYYIIRTSRLFGKQGSTSDAKKTFVDLIIETAKKNNHKIKAIDEEYDLPTYGFDLALKTREIVGNFLFSDLTNLLTSHSKTTLNFSSNLHPNHLQGEGERIPPLAEGVRGRVKVVNNNFSYGIYHVANSGEPCTWYGFACEIFDIKNMDVKIEPVGGDAFGLRPAKRLKYGMLNNTKLKSLRGWKEALKDYLIK